MTAKYIILAGAHPVLFGKDISHSDAARMARAHAPSFGIEVVSSAGFFSLESGKVTVWGSAQTLDDLEAQPEDAALIERLFRE